MEPIDWLQDFFKTREELKKDLQRSIEALNDSGFYEEAEKIKNMNWNELKKKGIVPVIVPDNDKDHNPRRPQGLGRHEKEVVI